jgi:phosphatidylglycerol---prolipoprotein diacylglyceryl transferase
VNFPVWLTVGAWKIHPHLFFELLGYAVGIVIFLALRQRKGDHIRTPDRWSIVTAAVLGAAVGSRLLFWMEDPAATAGYLRSAPAMLGGKTLVGALLGGWIAVEGTKRWIGLRSSTGDLFVVPLAFGIAVGRVGCFLSGLPDGTYGTATTLPWGVDLGDGVARHPTAIYESVFMLVFGAILSRVAPRLERGQLFTAFIAGYLLFRLVIDFIKPGVTAALGLTAIQLACVAGLAICARRLRHASMTAVRA